MDAILVVLTIVKGLADSFSLFPEYNFKTNEIQIPQSNAESDKLIGKMWIYKVISWVLLLVLFIGSHSINNPPVEFMILIWILSSLAISGYMIFSLNKLAKKQDVTLDTLPHRSRIIGLWGIASTLVLEILILAFYFMYLMNQSMPDEIKRQRVAFR